MMGDSNAYPDLLSAALSESGLSFDISDILNPASDTPVTTTSAPGIMAQAMSQSGLNEGVAANSTGSLLLPGNSLLQHPTATIQLGSQVLGSKAAAALSVNQLIRNNKMQVIKVQPGAGSGVSLVQQQQQRQLTAVAREAQAAGGALPRLGSATASLLGLAAATNGAVKRELTSRDVSRLWANEDLPLRSLSPNQDKVKPEKEEEEEEEVEEIGYSETYANYKPSKLKIGLDHPDSVVETSSLSSIQPPDIWYKMHLPEEVVDSAWLSALQLEAVVYASQQHETFLANGERAGFLIGDGAGVGKGRTVAGIIYENYIMGRKRALWFSVSNDLKYDAMRDLKDIGAGNIHVHSLNKFKYAKINSKENRHVKKGVVFATYSSLIGESQSGVKYRTRLKQLLQWCGEDFDGVIIFDECHKAKNLCPVGSSKPTKTGLTVLELQKRLPKARIVYCSATGASEPKNMAYMSRLGIWGTGTPFAEFNDFIQAIEKRGVGAMEIVAMDMKLRGMYMARQLSFAGVGFKIEEIPLDKKLIEMYDKSVQLWVEAREKFQAAAALMDGDSRMVKSMWGQFWSAHQRFFKYLCIASKVKHAVRLAREAVKNGRCVVIGLQSTGEARTLDILEKQGGELDDFVSTAKGVLTTLIEKHFPAPNRKRTANLLGLGLNFEDRDLTKTLQELSDDEDESLAPTTRRGAKRKGKPMRKAKAKRKNYRGQCLNDESGSDYNPEMSASSESSEDSWDDDEVESESEEDASEEVSEDEDDFNPFGNSDSEDDPWLNRGGRKSKTKQKPDKNDKKKKSKKNGGGGSSNSSMAADSDSSSLPAFKKSKNSSFGNNSVANTSNNSYSSSSFTPGMGAIEKAQQLKQELLDHVEELSPLLPPNTLDELIEELGGPDNVAEMTGRKGRIVSDDDGNVTYESRSELDIPLETLNLAEKKRFMEGEKYIAIISEAASSGISLQADKRVNNKRRRVHITLELPWSADRAIQQFGRTHRSNQVTAPEYLFLISELAGERRFASIVAKRLQSLGALTHGDRRATESRDLSRFNIDNKYGRAALEATMKSITKLESPLVAPPKSYEGNFFADVCQGLVGVGLVSEDNNYSLDKDYNNMSKFLNRILGMEVRLQNALFTYFTDTLAAIIHRAKRDGRWDMGILDIGVEGESVKKLSTRTFVGSFSTGTAITELITVSAERGISWEAALAMWREQEDPEEGFYLSQQVRNDKKTAVLVRLSGGSGGIRKSLYRLYRPNTGIQLRQETLADIRKKYRRVAPEQAQPHWTLQFQQSLTTCTHAFWRGNCRRVTLGMGCEVGRRLRTYYVLSGSVLSVWTKVENVLATTSHSHSSKMQIIRLKTIEGQRIVGCLIPPVCVNPLANALKQGSTITYTDNKKDEKPAGLPPST